MNDSTAPRDGDQWRLDLFKGEPWDGRSPRGLTRVQISLSLKRELPGHEVYVDPAQLDFFRRQSEATKRKRLPQAVGASSLLPLKARRRFLLARRGSPEGDDHGETA